MTQVDVQREILDTLTGLKEDVTHLKKDMHHIMEFLEDKQLSGKEKKLLDECIAKVKAGNESDFVSHEDLKKEIDF